VALYLAIDTRDYLSRVALYLAIDTRDDSAKKDKLREPAREIETASGASVTQIDLAIAAARAKAAASGLAA
jgi:hypothetical protein